MTFTSYAKNLIRILLAELVKRNARRSSPASQHPAKSRRPSAGLNYSAALLRAPSEVAATRAPENLSHDEIHARFKIPLVASNTR